MVKMVVSQLLFWPPTVEVAWNIIGDDNLPRTHINVDTLMLGIFRKDSLVLD